MAEESKNGHRSVSRTRRVSRALGALEARVMGVLWGSPADPTVHQVCDALGPNRNYKTVMTVLNRLVEKGLLVRRLDGRAYRYHPRPAQPQLLRSAADDLVEGYLQSHGPEAVAHLADAVSAVASRPRRATPSTAGAPTRRMDLAERPERASLGVLVALAAAIQALLFALSRCSRRRG